MSFKAATGGSNTVGHPVQHSKNPPTTPQGFLLMMRSVTTGHAIATVYVLRERFHHQGATKTESWAAQWKSSRNSTLPTRSLLGNWTWSCYRFWEVKGYICFLLSPTPIWLQKLFGVLHSSVFNHPSPCFKTMLYLSGLCWQLTRNKVEVKGWSLKKHIPAKLI